MNTAISRFDLSLTAAVQRLPLWLRPLMKAASLFGQPVAMGALLILAVLIGIQHHQSSQIEAFVAAFITLPIASVIKLAVHRTRPATYLRTRLPSYSFPSGHAYCTLLALGVIAFAAATPTVILLVVGIILLIGLSRIYLGAHFPSDVIGGWLIALAILGVIVKLTGL